MGETTHISWCQHTWNPWIGCTKVSPACDGCYAEAMMDKRYGRVVWGAPGKGNGTRSRTSASNWHEPYRWHKAAVAAGTRPFVFCASLADIFDNQVPTEWRADAFKVMRDTPQLVYLLLTKRPQNIIKLVAEVGYLPINAAIGTTIEDQRRADLNLPALAMAKACTPAAFSFVSCEPLLGPITISADLMPDWVITGGETDQGGHMARPTHPDWFRGLRDQCAAASVPFHHKQNGEWMQHEFRSNGSQKGERVVWPNARTDVGNANDGDGPGVDMDKIGKRRTGRLLDGVEHNGFPGALSESTPPDTTGR
ncbi:MAG: phage Gp37/Gp68 family protein [bacterium]|nr:phage Gp37/Gp68 family protein [bacterium]